MSDQPGHHCRQRHVCGISCDHVGHAAVTDRWLPAAASGSSAARSALLTARLTPARLGCALVDPPRQ